MFNNAPNQMGCPCGGGRGSSSPVNPEEYPEGSILCAKGYALASGNGTIITNPA